MEVIQFSPKYNAQVKVLVVSILEKEFNHTGVDRPDLEDIAGTYQSNEQS